MIRTLRADRLAVNGFRIGGSSLLTSALGMLFWVIAARRGEPAAVGIAASAIAGLGTVALIGQLGLVNALNRFLPRTPVPRRLLLRSAAAAASAGASMGLVAVAVGTARGHTLVTTTSTPVAWIVFPLLCGLWTMFVVQDGALAGTRRTGLLLRSNASYAIAKLALVLVLPATDELMAFWAWTIPLPVAVGVVWWRLVRDAPPDTQPRIPDADVMRRFMLGDHLGSVSWTAAQAVVPVLLLSQIGAADTAVFSLAFSVAYGLQLVGRGMAMSLLTEVVDAPDDSAALGRRAVARAALITVPGALVLAAGSGLFLRIFGSQYALDGAVLLTLLALSTIPALLLSTGLSLLRARDRTGRLAALSALLGTALLVLLGPAADRGLVGVGVLWLAIHLAGAAIVAPSTLLGHVLRGTPTSAAVRVRSLGGRLGQARRATAAATARLPGPTRRAVSLRTGRPDLSVRWLRASGEPDLLLRVAHSNAARASLERHAAGLATIPDTLRGAITMPRLVEIDLVADTPFLVERQVPGIPSTDADPAAVVPLIAAVLRTIRAATCTPSQLTQREDWADEAARPLRWALVEAGRWDDVACLDYLVAHLAKSLGSSSMPAAFCHGDLWLGNILLAPTGEGAMSVGLIDLESALAAGPALLDGACFAISLRSDATTSLADAVKDLTTHGFTTAERDAFLGPAEVDDSTLALLAWLHLCSANVAKSARYQPGTRWFVRNVEPILGC